ncbi:hypothetical protein ACFW96_37030 [Streptomyces gardneri]|uniref:hypothetical protein n=1 Tax=Streptomyces gardneri TaxID=66892 RepID=UPI0036974E31
MPEDDASVCVEEVPGQLGLFAPWPRTFTREHARRIAGRTLLDLPAVVAELRKLAAERGTGATWMEHTSGGARLALASRPPDEHLVRPEALVDLPQMRPTIHLALQRARLLAPARPRLVSGWMSKRRGSCTDCLAWTNDDDQRCAKCLNWRRTHPAHACDRCGRLLPVRDGHCRRCLLLLAETEYDLDRIALDGADQLWFGGVLAPRLRTSTDRTGRMAGIYGRRRLQTKRLALVRATRAAWPVSEHLAVPGQLPLFVMDRDWSAFLARPMPALTPAATRLVDGFAAHIHTRSWNKDSLQASLRGLRILTAHFGADAPLHEADIRRLARYTHLAAPRVINYLRSVGLLAPDAKSDAHLAGARRLADQAPGPFRAGAHRWIDVLCAAGSRPSWPLAPSTVRSYVRKTAPCLKAWHAAGVDDFRAVTVDHVQQALAPLRGEARKSLLTALRSLFRALKREKLIFRDPTRALAVTTARPLLADDQLVGALDRLTSGRDRLTLALAAVHALSVHDQRGLLLDDLDRTRGLLLVRRAGGTKHVVYLDELTHQLVTQWLAERHRRWPASTNPYLLITAQTSADDRHPKAHSNAISKPLRRIGLQASRLRADRILDEAKHTADPVQLIKLFGLSSATAWRYVRAAHPERIHREKGLRPTSRPTMPSDGPGAG